MTPEKDKLYRIDCPASAYHGAVVMCTGDKDGVIFDRLNQKLPTYPCRVLFSPTANVTQVLYIIADHLGPFNEKGD